MSLWDRQCRLDSRRVFQHNQSEAAIASVCNAVTLDIPRCGAREIASARMAHAGRQLLDLLKDGKVLLIPRRVDIRSLPYQLSKHRLAPEYPCVLPSRGRSTVHLGTIAREKQGCPCCSNQGVPEPAFAYPRTAISIPLQIPNMGRIEAYFFGHYRTDEWPLQRRKQKAGLLWRHPTWVAGPPS